jgi:HPt (histidine-containing phosphotransfer) domain-containing protein
MAADQPVSKRVEGPSDTSASALPDDELSHESMLELFEQDAALLSELAELFLEDSPALLHDIQAGVAALDAGMVERAAHTLKGSVGNFGAKRALELARRIEAMARGRDLSGAPEALSALEQEMARVSALMAAEVPREKLR